MLTETDRLLIIAGCVGLLSAVGILTMCVVCPVCCVYKCLFRKKGDNEYNERRSITRGLPLGYLQGYMDKDPPPPYESTSFSDLREIAMKLSPTSSTSSARSEIDSVTGIPLPTLDENHAHPSENHETSSQNRGHVCFSLTYALTSRSNEKPSGEIRMHLKEVGGLPARPYGGSCDAYLVVSLLGKRREPLQHRRSEIRGRSNAHQEEWLCFSLGATPPKKCHLRLEAWDRDRWANDTPLGEAVLPLKGLNRDLLSAPTQEVDVELKLHSPKLKNGELLLGLCYLPTAERLTITILRATNLKKLDQNSDVLAPYVQATALFDGKAFDRRKTSSRGYRPDPVFNEMLMFDVPASKLDRVFILVAIRICPSALHRTSTRDPSIGKVVLGSQGGRAVMGHWGAMRGSPRRQVVQWHQLS